jgi:hypothetical protein
MLFRSFFLAALAVPTGGVVAASGGVGAAAQGLNPVPQLRHIPVNASSAWLRIVYADPRAFGIDDWTPFHAELTNVSPTAFYIDFRATYPIDKQRLRSAAPDLQVAWQSPRIEQRLSLELWKAEVDGDLKKESSWITPGRLTWTLVNFVYECAVPHRIYRILVLSKRSCPLIGARR